MPAPGSPISPAPELPPHLPDEAAITRLVHAFYARARTDWLLGPVFEATVHDWPAHLDTLVRFWSSVLLRTARYRGNPMAAHRPLFEALRGLRTRLAREQGVPPYVIFHDATLREIARHRPHTPGDLALIGGIGAGKIERYGDEVLDLVAEVEAA